MTLIIAVAAFILAVSAFIVLTVLLWLLWDVWKQIERDNNGWDEARKRRRSEAAKQGWQTKRAKLAELAVEVDRMERSLDGQDSITPDDALGFVQRGEEQ